MIDWMRRLTKRTAPTPRQEIDPSWPPTPEEVALREARTEEALARRYAMNAVRSAHRIRNSDPVVDALRGVYRPREPQEDSP